jgi:hypothetical protein
MLAAHGAGQVGAEPDEDQAEVLAELATLVEALMIARATVGDPVSDAVLTAARRRLGCSGPSSFPGGLRSISAGSGGSGV